MQEFWQGSLQYGPKYPAKDGWVILRDPEGKNPNVSDDREGEVERLLKMGATLHPRTYKPDEDFRILVDPEGNHFCVVQ